MADFVVEITQEQPPQVIVTPAVVGGTGEGGEGTTDHGALTGLADDDHAQYHNNARGDARYSQLGHAHAAQQVFENAVFFKGGTLTAAPGVGRFPVPVAATIVEVRATVNTAPTTSGITIDVNRNGTTIYTTQGNRPTIAAGSNASSVSTNMDVTSLAAGDYLTVDVDAIGSGIAGADLVVLVRYRY